MIDWDGPTRFDRYLRRSLERMFWSGAVFGSAVTGGLVIAASFLLWLAN